MLIRRLCQMKNSGHTLTTILHCEEQGATWTHDYYDLTPDISYKTV